ncbi:MAG: glycosyltransferase family 4 protein [Chloroflexi bacterium]|uniref:Glycosyltransferase family 4 protein n=1 Tax=Candidatus Chlorohelix allophototropha TaxID=3003348 RepID=A0A8T7M301_9CHLR|nr:glycosyltransferase family 4 protein [Chloroflexota bacterium]WJW66051.1 glycosyltransferase family 4 protein [Chloroflexota bacterium L227-S17]
MRILTLSWEYTPNVVGGLGRHVTELAPALAKLGVEVHVLTPMLKGGDSFEHTTKNIYIHRVEPPQADFNDFFSLAWETNLKLQEAANRLIDHYKLQNKQFDLIHVHDWLVAFTGGALKEQYHIPMIATIHATERGRGRGYLPGDLPRAINNVEWWLNFEAWRIICCSEYMKSEVMDYFETPADKIDIVVNGVDTERFDLLEGEDLSEFRSHYALPEEKIIFYVGRMVDEKGLRPLIESAPYVLRTTPNVKYVLTGTGPQLEEYKLLAKTLGVSHKFYFTGFISDETRDKLYKVVDVATFPSLYEPFGIVALEAMAARTPLVVSDTGGVSDVVKNHETGVKVISNDPSSIAWGILHTLNNPTWTTARVENAYKAVKEHYNWQGIAAQTIAIYKRVLREYKESGWGKKA